MWVDSLLRATDQPVSALMDALFETSKVIGTCYPVSNQLENLFSLAELRMWELLSWSDRINVPHYRRAWGKEKDERKPTLHSLHRIFTGELVTSSRFKKPRGVHFRTRVSCLSIQESLFLNPRFLCWRPSSQVVFAPQTLRHLVDHVLDLSKTSFFKNWSIIEDPLEKGMATHSSILAWRIPWTEEPGRLGSMHSKRVRHYWATNTFTHIDDLQCCINFCCSTKWSSYIYIYMYI